MNGCLSKSLLIITALIALFIGYPHAKKWAMDKLDEKYDSNYSQQIEEESEEYQEPESVGSKMIKKIIKKIYNNKKKEYEDFKDKALDGE